jgi:DNA-binding NarL/FixJ family response regulator
MHVLKTYLIEDSPVIRQSLIATLEDLAPVEVVGTAEDEQTAVLWLSKPENLADLVIIDIFLKAGSGLGVLRAVGNLNLVTKFVVLTNYATSDMKRKCLELGADRVFDKSNDIDALLLYCSRLANGEPDTTLQALLP